MSKAVSILLDIGLPQMDGYEVARRLRHDGYDGLLVALAGNGQEKDRLMAQEAGFDEHVVKPPDVETIEQLLRHPKLA